MRGKHAKLSEQKQIRDLKAMTDKLKTNLAAEQKERKMLQSKLTDQSSMLKEIARLRGQVNDRVSDKYLKLEKKYDKTKNTISKLESSMEQKEKGVGKLLGMYAKERKITRTEALDEWVSKVTGKDNSLVLFETYKDGQTGSKFLRNGRLTRIIENMRRKKFEAQARWEQSANK